jgi:hypothetical protein
MEKEFNLSMEIVSDLKTTTDAEDESQAVNSDNSISKAALISYLIS